VRGGRRKYFLGVSEMVFMPSMAQRFQSRLAPVSTSMSSRSSGHRAQPGGARSAREAALRRRLPLSLEKRCFSSACQAGLTAFLGVVHAFPGATSLASTGPGLALLGKAFGPRKALLFVCFADRASPCLARPPRTAPPNGDLHPAGPTIHYSSRKRWITGVVSGLIPRQMRKDSAACSTSMPRPSAAAAAPVSRAQRTNGVAGSP